jgi:hypothetical protein
MRIQVNSSAGSLSAASGVDILLLCGEFRLLYRHHDNGIVQWERGKAVQIKHLEHLCRAIGNCGDMSTHVRKTWGDSSTLRIRWRHLFFRVRNHSPVLWSGYFQKLLLCMTWTFCTHNPYALTRTVLSVSLVKTAWRVIRLRMEETVSRYEK